MGEAARQSGIPRNEIFLTTKILSAGGSPEKTYQKCLDSVHKIDGEKGYIDLFLLHSPSGGSAAVKEMYQALERLESEGKVKSIGVSNFGVGHIEAMKSYARIWPPHVNQIEVCPTLISMPHFTLGYYFAAFAMKICLCMHFLWEILDSVIFDPTYLSIDPQLL